LLTPDLARARHGGANILLAEATGLHNGLLNTWMASSRGADEEVTTCAFGQKGDSILSCAHLQWLDISRPSQHVSTLLLKKRRDAPLASLWRQHREWLTTLTSCGWQDAFADYGLSWAAMPTVKDLACWDANFTPIPFTVAFQLTPSSNQSVAVQSHFSLQFLRLYSAVVPLERAAI